MDTEGRAGVEVVPTESCHPPREARGPEVAKLLSTPRTTPHPADTEHSLVDRGSFLGWSVLLVLGFRRKAGVSPPHALSCHTAHCSLPPPTPAPSLGPLSRGREKHLEQVQRFLGKGVRSPSDPTP